MHVDNRPTLMVLRTREWSFVKAFIKGCGVFECHSETQSL